MRFAHYLVLLALIAGCATDAPVEMTSEVVTAEHLLAEPPAGFNLVYQFNNGDTRLAEFVPKGETGIEWDTKVFFESNGQFAESDPIDILMAEVARLKENCNFVNHYNLFSGYENAYPTSVRLILCGNNSLLEKGELSLAKVIQGDQFLYVIRIVRRLPPFEADQAEIAPQEVAIWSEYLSHIKLCNTGDQAHACPATEEVIEQ